MNEVVAERTKAVVLRGLGWATSSTRLYDLGRPLSEGREFEELNFVLNVLLGNGSLCHKFRLSENDFNCNLMTM